MTRLPIPSALAALLVLLAAGCQPQGGGLATMTADLPIPHYAPASPCDVPPPFSFDGFAAYADRELADLDWAARDAAPLTGEERRQCASHAACMAETVWDYSEFYKMTREQYCDHQCRQTGQKARAKHDADAARLASARRTHTLAAYRAMARTAGQGPEAAQARLMAGFVEEYNDALLRQLCPLITGYQAFALETRQADGGQGRCTNRHDLRYTLTPMGGGRIALSVSGLVAADFGRSGLFGKFETMRPVYEEMIDIREARLRVDRLEVEMTGQGRSANGDLRAGRTRLVIFGTLETDLPIPEQSEQPYSHRYEPFAANAGESAMPIPVINPLWGEGKAGEGRTIRLLIDQASPDFGCVRKLVRAFVGSDARLPTLPATGTPSAR